MKALYSFISILFFSGIFAQQGDNYSIPLSDIDNYSKKKNIALYQDHIEKIADGEKAWYTTQTIEVPQTIQNTSFISLSASLSYTYLDGEIELEYRVRTGKKWRGWLSMVEDDHNTSIVPKLYYLPAEIPNSASEVQLRIKNKAGSSFKLSDLNLRFYFPGEATLEVVKKNESSQVEILQKGTKSVNCNCPLPDIEYRDDWCPSGNCPMDDTPTPTVVSHLVVHHSAGSNTSPNWAATVRSIWDYHVNNRGWDDIGYNFLIDPNGVIYEGRGNDVSGAHFSCMNPSTMGVCLLGNFTTASPSNAMINSLTVLLGWKVCDIDKDPRETSYFSTGAVDLVNLCGHRDGNSIPASCTVTECPGDNVYAIMGNLRTAVYDYSQTCMLTPNYSNIVILDMNSNPATVYEDEMVDLEVDFKNIGAADIAETLNINFEVNGASIGSNSFNALAINQSLTRSVSHTFPAPGTYNYCTYIDAASNEINTSNNSYCVNLEVLEKLDTSATSIYDVIINATNIYPNPTKDALYVDSEYPIKSYRLYNALGQLIKQDFEWEVIDLAHLNQGVYTLTLLFENENFEKSWKFLKQ